MKSDRRTRDRIRLFFWAVLTIVCLAALMLARQQQQQGFERKVGAARERAVRFTQNVLGPQLDAVRVSVPIAGAAYDELLEDVRHGLFNDQRVVRVRVWRPDGLLVFTTDDPEQAGVVTSDDEDLRAALRGDVVTGVQTGAFARDTSTTPVQTELLSTYVPLGASDVRGVVEVDNDFAIIQDSTSNPWQQMQIAFGIVGVLCFAMTIVSFVWSHRAEEVTRLGPTRRQARAATRDEKRAGTARAEALKLRERVKELEGASRSTSQQHAEAEKLRAQVAELEGRLATVPAETGGEARVAQLQTRVTEMEAQLFVTGERLRTAERRVEEAEAVPVRQQAEAQAQLEAAAATEEVLRADLQASRAETERLQQERAEIERTHAEELLAQQSQSDQVRAQARLTEEERQRILAEDAKTAAAAQPTVSADARTRIRELEQLLKRSENERAMLRAGRPETVYEARNRELEDELAMVRERLIVAEERARSVEAAKAGVETSVIAALEARIASAEARALEAERRLDEMRGGRGSRPRSRTNGTGGGDEPSGAGDAASEEAAPAVDGSELRSRLVRSNDAKRRGAAPTRERR